MIYTIYSGAKCQYCEMAKGLLRQNGIKFIEININKSAEAKEKLLNMGFRGIPVLMLDDTCIASNYDDIERWIKNDKKSTY